MTVAIREAGSEDASALSELVGALGYPCGVPVMRERLRCFERRADHLLRLAVDDLGQPLGVAHAFQGFQLHSPPFVEIASLVVAEQARGAGVGSRLIEAVIAWARAHRIYRVRVHSRIQREAAHAFYARQGFAPTKTQHVLEYRLASGPGQL